MPKSLSPDTQPLPTKLLLKGWVIWAIAAIFYAYEFVLRVSPAVIIDDLILAFSAFSISKANLGSFAALYFYAYALCQIPAGVLCDHFGARRLLTIACFIITIGSFMFTTTHTLWVANLSRILIGSGSAFAFVGCLKLAASWMPPRIFPLVVGLTSLCGSIGAILGNKPFAQFVLATNWRDAYFMLSVIGVGLTLAIWVIVRNNPADFKIEDSTKEPHALLSGLNLVLHCKQSWIIALFGCLLVAPIAGFAEMWGATFFQTVYKIPKDEAAGLIAYIFIGIACGGPLIGWVSSRFARYRLIMLVATTLACMALFRIIFHDELSLNELRLLLFGYGLLTSNMLLCFSLITFKHPNWASGAAVGFTNMMIMGGAAITQPIIGKLLDIKSHTTQNIIFTPQDFQLALVILPSCLILAIVLTLFIKPVHKEETNFNINREES